ncbi:type VII secretion target [Actinokineospora sp.]|uniref:type VII secretion target n=1 Tax=Actinokineospora sp. TaxID=1872133 RepID=UPI003D6C0F2C
MAEQFTVVPDQIRAHAANVAAVLARFEAVKGASQAIAQDDEAYGTLCGWISGLLEGKHTRQDELFAKVAENLRLVTAALTANADAYEDTEDTNTSALGGGK